LSARWAQASVQHANGDRYVGGFTAEGRHGDGTLSYASGERYEVRPSPPAWTGPPPPPSRRVAHVQPVDLNQPLRLCGLFGGTHHSAIGKGEEGNTLSVPPRTPTPPPGGAAGGVPPGSAAGLRRAVRDRWVRPVRGHLGGVSCNPPTPFLLLHLFPSDGCNGMGSPRASMTSATCREEQHTTWQPAFDPARTSVICNFKT